MPNPNVNERQFRPIYHGDQGVMFSHNEMRRMLVKPPDEHRYQRGYTPERMAEVRGAMAAPVTRGLAIRRGDEEHPFGGQEGSAKAMEAIARSTIPTEHLQKLGKNLSTEVTTTQYFDREAKEDPYTGRKKLPLGEYHQPQPFDVTRPTEGAKIKLWAKESEQAAHARINKEEGWSEEDNPYSPARGRWRVKGMRNKTEDAELTLLHEVGHHASYLAGTGAYATPAERGAEEARADNFAHQHHVRDPRTVKGTRAASGSKVDLRGWHSYEGTHGTAHDPYGESEQDQADFHTAYQAGRTHRLPAPPNMDVRYQEEKEAKEHQLFHPGEREVKTGPNWWDTKRVPAERVNYRMEPPDKYKLNPNLNQQQHG